MKKGFNQIWMTSVIAGILVILYNAILGFGINTINLFAYFITGFGIAIVPLFTIKLFFPKINRIKKLIAIGIAASMIMLVSFSYGPHSNKQVEDTQTSVNFEDYTCFNLPTEGLFQRIFLALFSGLIIVSSYLISEFILKKKLFGVGK